jgi:putative hemolysin
MMKIIEALNHRKTPFGIALGLSIFLYSPIFARGFSVDFENFKLNGVQIKLLHVGSLHLLVSPRCLMKDPKAWQKNQKCEAIQKLKTLSLKGSETLLADGANPGAVVCLKTGGKIFTALDAKSNQISLCKFSDGSFVSSASLHHYARENDSQALANRATAATSPKGP